MHLKIERTLNIIKPITPHSPHRDISKNMTFTDFMIWICISIFQPNHTSARSTSGISSPLAFIVQNVMHSFHFWKLQQQYATPGFLHKHHFDSGCRTLL